MQSNVAVRLEGNVLITVHNATAPTHADWDIYVQAVNQQAPRIMYQLVWSAGGGPNAAQRKHAVEATKKAIGNKVPKTAVMTTSHAVRAMVTLFNWFYPGIYTAFSSTDFEGAFLHLNVPRFEHAKYEAVLAEMRASVRA